MLRASLAAIAFLAGVTPTVRAAVEWEPLSGLAYAGRCSVNVATGEVLDGAPAARFVGDVYENTLAPSSVNVGLSSTTLTNIYGDNVVAEALGTLDQMDVTVFNSSSSGNTMPLESIQLSIEIRRDFSLSLIGGFTTNVVFPTAIQPGNFALVTFTNLASLATPIELDTGDLIIEQQRLSHTGGSTRLGVASMLPINHGDSPTTYRLNGALASIAGTAVNPGYRLGVVPEPASIALLALGMLGVRRTQRARSART